MSLSREGAKYMLPFQMVHLGKSKESASRGCKYVEVDINRRGKNPAEDIGLFRKYRQIMQKVKPDAVLAYTVKCDIYGGLAASHCEFRFSLTSLD